MGAVVAHMGAVVAHMGVVVACNGSSAGSYGSNGGSYESSGGTYGSSDGPLVATPDCETAVLGLNPAISPAYSGLPVLRWAAIWDGTSL